MTQAFAIAALWFLGCWLMRDNIRAQPHEYYPGRSIILIGMIVGWPLVVIYSLVFDLFHKEAA
jgi:hypothetical protein